MTTHVFIVNEATFTYHLQYLFAGTGAGDKDIDFNNSSKSVLYPAKSHASESSLVALMTDCCRIRKGDLILFYLQATKKQEGMFYGVFKAVGDSFLDRPANAQFLYNQIGKNLPFRVRIEPYQVYAKGVTEWKAMDEIRNITSPCQMLWSLIYRKLKGNRGNTMITIYESERLIDLIRRENNNKSLSLSASYSYEEGLINMSDAVNDYPINHEVFNILPRLISKHNAHLAYESHLQMYITQNLGRNVNLDQALGIGKDVIEWIGNEVSCGVGMQRIDIMISVVPNQTQRVIMPIELKCKYASSDNIRQINRYIDWIEQYYIPNRVSTIQPVLLCLSGGLTDLMVSLFHSFNNASNGRYLPLRYVEYSVVNNSIVFNNIYY